MASEPKLVVGLEARVREFEKQLARAEKAAAKSMGDIERRGKKMTGGLERSMTAAAGKIGGLAKSFGGGLLAGVAAGGIAGIATQIGQIAQGIAEIGDAAKRAGIDAQSFQELGYVASQNRIAVDALTDGVKELQLRSDEFIATGGGPAAEAFQRLGYSADELKRKLADPVDLFTEIIGKLGELDRAAQIRIADEIFGGSAGERFVQLIEQGAEGMRRTRQEARDLGIVLSDDVLQKAAELDRLFGAAANTVGNSLKRGIIEAASALVEFIDSFRAFENQQNRTLNSKLTDLGAERLKVENEILDVRRQQEELTGFTAQAERRLLDGTIAALAERQAAIAAEEKRILGILGSRTTPAITAPTFKPFVPAGGSASVRTGGGGRRIADEFTDAAKAAREFEQAQRDAARSAEQLGDAVGGAIGGLVDALSDGKLEAGELLGVLRNLAQQLLSMPSVGGGGGFASGLLSSLLGSLPGFAAGTNYAPGGMAIVGERGPEIVSLPRGSKVVPNHRIGVPRVHAPANDNRVHVTVGVAVDGNGNLMPFVQSVAQSEAARSTAALSRQVPKMVDARVDTRQTRKTRA